MRCVFKDGVSIDYSGSLSVTKGDNIACFLKNEEIPANYRGILDWAEHSHNCNDMRRVAEEVTEECCKRSWRE